MNIGRLTTKITVVVCMISLVACANNFTVPKNSVGEIHRDANPEKTQIIPPRSLTTAPKVCTLIGCMNSIAVTFPQRLAYLTGEYRMEITLDNNSIKYYKIIANNSNVNACEQDSVEPVNGDLHDSVFLKLNSVKCQREAHTKPRHVNKFNGFSLLNVTPKYSMDISIKNSSGQHVLQEAIDLTRLSPKLIEPNGSGCGGCQYIEVDLR